MLLLLGIGKGCCLVYMSFVQDMWVFYRNIHGEGLRGSKTNIPSFTTACFETEKYCTRPYLYNVLIYEVSNLEDTCVNYK